MSFMELSLCSAGFSLKVPRSSSLPLPLLQVWRGHCCVRGRGRGAGVEWSLSTGQCGDDDSGHMTATAMSAMCLRTDYVPCGYFTLEQGLLGGIWKKAEF